MSGSSPTGEGALDYLDLSMSDLEDYGRQRMTTASLDRELGEAEAAERAQAAAASPSMSEPPGTPFDGVGHGQGGGSSPSEEGGEGGPSGEGGEGGDGEAEHERTPVVDQYHTFPTAGSEFLPAECGSSQYGDAEDNADETSDSSMQDPTGPTADTATGLPSGPLTVSTIVEAELLRRQNTGDLLDEADLRDLAEDVNPRDLPLFRAFSVNPGPSTQPQVPPLLSPMLDPRIEEALAERANTNPLPTFDPNPDNHTDPQDKADATLFFGPLSTLGPSTADPPEQTDAMDQGGTSLPTSSSPAPAPFPGIQEFLTLYEIRAKEGTRPMGPMGQSPAATSTHQQLPQQPPPTYSPPAPDPAPSHPPTVRAALAFWETVGGGSGSVGPVGRSPAATPTHQQLPQMRPAAPPVPKPKPEFLASFKRSGSQQRVHQPDPQSTEPPLLSGARTPPKVGPKPSSLQSSPSLPAPRGSQKRPYHATSHGMTPPTSQAVGAYDGSDAPSSSQHGLSEKAEGKRLKLTLKLTGPSSDAPESPADAPEAEKGDLEGARSSE
ncbi:hypothetical protein B0T16DRAFT_457758 [Cercophora newfieldiana]|uniref:Uncharacterized protein n=1 Tax=Cercophora newfieldiana TaxID=92897 RepID=A0AA39Y4A1_9PEZI|nr:hypothetical protein B0T16DRAFT_457758 [Cercophora newfieldiana]